MAFLKTSFTIALLACFLTVKTNAQVGLTMKHVKKSVVFKQQTNPLKLKPHTLEIPKENSVAPSFRRSALGVEYINYDQILYIFSPKSNANLIERAAATILLFGQR